MSLIYLVVPYAEVTDKDELVAKVTDYIGNFMVKYPTQHVISPVLNHYIFQKVPKLKEDPNFWRTYSLEVMRKCDRVIVYQYAGWEASVSVQAELKNANHLAASGVFTDKDSITYYDPYA